MEHIDEMSQCIGKCECIYQIAVSLNYAKHSLALLTLWLLTLPFGVLQNFELLTAPIMGAMA